MKTRFGIILFLLISLLSGLDSIAQTTTVSLNARVVKTSPSDPNNYVYLRILPVGDTLPGNHASVDYYLNAWNRYKENGYVIKRRRANSTIVEKTDTIRIDSTQLALLSEDSLQGVNHEGAVFLYGSLFDTVDTTASVVSGDSIQINNEGADEYAQRYILTALGAEISFRAARLSGLGWIDSSAISGVSYEYEVVEMGVTGADSTFRSAKILIDVNYIPLVSPPTPKAVFGDKKVVLSWKWLDDTSNTSLDYQRAYSSYFIEQSVISSSSGFQRVSRKPIIPLSDQSDSLFFTVPLQNNNVLNHFKIIGISPFNEEMVSSVVSGLGRSEGKLFYPHIDSSKVESATAYIKWSFPADTIVAQADTLINGYIIQKSADLNSFQVVSTGGGTLISPNTSEITIPFSADVPYYVVSAIFKSGDTLSSIPVMLQTVDDTPPSTPIGLQAVWLDNNTKSVQISWTANSETDLLGYKLFRSNLLTEEPSVIADSLTSSSFVDSLIKVDNSRAYYYIVAYDKRFNHSLISEPAILQKPDLFPPTTPYFTSHALTSGGINLKWNNSSSADVATHRLTRKVYMSTGETIISTWTQGPNSQTYTDSTVDMTKSAKFSYKIIAVDSTGNTSQDSITVDVFSTLLLKPDIDTVSITLDSLSYQVRLTWTYSVPEIAEFQLMKGTETNNISSWKIVDKYVKDIIDNNAVRGSVNYYSLRAVFLDGVASEWKQVFIEVPD